MASHYSYNPNSTRKIIFHPFQTEKLSIYPFSQRQRCRHCKKTNEYTENEIEKKKNKKYGIGAFFYRPFSDSSKHIY